MGGLSVIYISYISGGIAWRDFYAAYAFCCH